MGLREGWAPQLQKLLPSKAINLFWLQNFQNSIIRTNYSIFVSSQSQNGFEVTRCGGFFSRNKMIDFSFLVIGERTDAPLLIEYKIQP